MNYLLMILFELVLALFFICLIFAFTGVIIENVSEYCQKIYKTITNKDNEKD